MVVKSSMERRRYIYVATRCSKPLVGFLAFFAGIVTLAVVERGLEVQISGELALCTLHKRDEPKELFQSAWHGTKAYPTVSSREESWEWLMVFMQSITAFRKVDNVEKEAISMIKSVGKLRRKDASVVSIR